jgi:uncharacterized protein
MDNNAAGRTAYSRDNFLDVFQRSKTIAVVGASDNSAKPANAIPAYLQEQGYQILPVNPRGGQILGQHVFASLDAVDTPVDVVDVFRPPAEAEEIARQAIAAGAKVLWFQPGTHTEQAVRLATDAGLTVVAGHCMGATHAQLGLGRPGD